MTTLFDAILKTAECLKGLRYSTSTAGSASSLTDANINEPDGHFKRGTLFFRSGLLAGKTAVISDFISGTFSFPAQTFVVDPGVSYAAMDSNYTREALVAAINSALSVLGPFPKITTDATLLTVTNQEEYTLPVGVFNVKKVFIATSQTEPLNYQENKGWFEENGKLHFDMQTPSTDGMQIKIYHEAPHPTVNLDTDTIMNAIFPDLLCWTAASRAVIVRMGIAENSEPHTKEMLPFAQQMANAEKGHAIKHWQKASRPSGW
ncbi:MAG: hypothetical protein WAW52_01765 [Methanothrix sp.]